MREADFIAYGGPGAACSINGELPIRDYSFSAAPKMR
jgi:hypothetical protein